ncbi:hypothetical protein BZG00_10520 [Salinivibrio kushneri]|uniref:TOD1/MUCI70 glycosyltransferase-like domain-containing protein n=1 Tax=Salinivibrio kushneri TaxID=1908198 RepID=A0AB36JUK3_9GAMM|nr:glycosyltransferase domain-containing protein [Salinivibrio kushneri]OOE39315.1 hypothetical protein BZG00_10520 [Salinivibrio kushneri]QCP02453.1 DUF616 domain-containing protein [Salinivibrio kushneri]
MNKVVYTVLMGDYDFIFPPAEIEGDIDYIVFTNRKDFKVKGWVTREIDCSIINTFEPIKANRHIKMLPHKYLQDYDVSIYVDSNIRVMKRIKDLFEDFLASGKDVGLLKHPLRNSVYEEIDACIMLGKVRSKDKLLQEYERYLEAGFKDSAGLTENNVIIRKHHQKDVIEAMNLWWDCFEMSAGRDQISLPYVREKCTLNEYVYPFNTRVENHHFKVYPHKKTIGLLIWVHTFMQKAQ